MSLDTGPLLDARGYPLSVGQGNHIRRFNELGRVMASMPDMYQAGKDASPEVLKSLQKDFQETWIISSTRIHYEKDSLEAVITHYFNSTATTPQPIKVLIPFYNGNKLDDVLGTEEGLHYLQALFNTNDNAETIKSTLEKLSNKKSKDIIVWTPDQNNRKEYVDRAAVFDYDDSGLFLVYGNINIGYDGRSRGVLDSPEGSEKNMVAANVFPSKEELFHQVIDGVEYEWNHTLKDWYECGSPHKLEIDDEVPSFEQVTVPIQDIDKFAIHPKLEID